MSVRKYLYLALVVAPAMGIAAPIATAQAATVHVLTVGKAGGTAVAKGAVLKASLVTGTKATFSLGASGSVSCSSSSFSAKVTNNPAKPGTATESLTAQTFSKCTITLSGVTVKSVVVNNLPFNVAVKDSAGDPVTVSGTSKAKPISTTITIAAGTLTASCTYGAASITGAASNTHNTITFTKQAFKFITGSSVCPTGSPLFSASFGPVVDSSVSGSPKVFVN